jgi:hypothetical protein
MKAKAEAAGYTIPFLINIDEIRLRKPGSSVNATGNSDVYARVFRGPNGTAWGFEECTDDLSSII